MTSKIQNWLLPLFFLCVCFTGVVRAEEEIQTFMTFSVSSWNTALNDLKTIGETSSNPAFAAMVEGPARFFFGKKVMKAADLDAPIGMALQKVKGSETRDAMLIFCVPVKDPMLVVELLAQRTGSDPDVTKNEDGIIRWGGQFLKEINGFTWFASDERQLAQLDSVNPKTFFGLKDGQSFQLTFDFQAFPEIYTKYTEAFDEGIELALKKEDGESNEEFDLRKKSAGEQKKQVVEFLRSLQLCTLGFSVNPNEKSVEMNMTVSFTPDSEGARLVEKSQDLKPMFTGFAQAQGMIHGYGVRLGVPYTQELQKNQLKTALDQWQEKLGEEEKTFFSRELVEPILNEMLSQTETFSGYVLDGKKGAHNMIFAVSTSEVAKVRELGEKSVEFAKKKLGPKFKDEWFQTGVEARGMTFSRLAIPTEELARLACEEAKEEYDAKETETLKTWFGETLTVVVGGKENQLLIGLGKDPLAKLGECLSVPETAHLSEMTFNLREIFRYIEELMVFVRENDLVKAEVQLKTKALPLPDENGVVEEPEEDEEEIVEDDSDSENDLKEIESTMGVLLEMMDGTEKTNVRMTVDATGNEIQIKIVGEEGVTKIIGLYPSRLLLNFR